MEAKKQGAGEEDLSMEEILQSIRRIIADDNDGGKPQAEPVAVASDILELTDMIEEDGSITDLKAVKSADVVKEVEKPVEKSSEKPVDVLNNIDAALAKEVVANAEKSDPIVSGKPENIEKKVEKMSAPDNDILLSKDAADTALSALSKLNVPEELPPERPTTPSPVFRSGTSVEDMVAEMIRPMLKDWLDVNLPIIVERIVEREVTRLSRR